MLSIAGASYEDICAEQNWISIMEQSLKFKRDINGA